jgi:alkanesulfonate monooxygenase SsuD/methylene tetrahydromethanopterin reductase-like flavin-dependent oxidoreductase (luciferase family)
MLMPPGYTTAGSFRRMLQVRGLGGPTAAPDLNAGEVLVGTPEQVGERLIRNMERCGAGIFMGMFQVGDMPHSKVMRSMELFADKVMPYLPREPVTVPAA